MNLKEFADDVHSARHQFGEPGRNFGSSSVCRGRCRSNRRGWLRAPVRPLLVSRRRSRTRHRARSGFLGAIPLAEKLLRISDCTKRAGRPQGRAVPPISSRSLIAAPEIGSPTRRLCRSLLRSLTSPSPSRDCRSSFTNVRETKMTHSLEIQIEELRAELTGTISDRERRLDQD